MKTLVFVVLLLLLFCVRRSTKYSPLTKCRKPGYKGPLQEPPHPKSSHTKTTNSSSRSSGVWSCSVLFAESYPFRLRKFFDQTEMATTVGAILASSKLAVTQGDLHLS